MPRIFDLEQGSPEWFEKRRGVITATRAQALFARNKGDTAFTKQRQHAVAEIAMERLNHAGKPHVTGAALRRGNDFEGEALDAYMFATGEYVEPCGFLLHDEHDVFGCSPDGFVGDKGMAQIKVPTSVLKHVEYLQTCEHADEYKWQLLHEMYTSDRDWTDIVSYNPESPPALQIAKKRVQRPDSWSEYEALLMAADNAIEDMVTALKYLPTQQDQAA